MLEDAQDALTSKVMGLPGWAWLLIGVGIFFFFSRGKKQSPGSANYSMSTPTTDQMTGNAVNDLRNDMMTEFEDRFGDITEANATAYAGTQQMLAEFADKQSVWFQDLIKQDAEDRDAMLGAVNSNSAAYMDALQRSNASFVDMLNKALATFRPNSTAPTTTNDPGATLPDWAKTQLQNPWYQKRKYLTDMYLDGPYKTVLDEFFRADTENGLNTTGQTQLGWTQLQSLMSSGHAVINPYA